MSSPPRGPQRDREPRGDRGAGTFAGDGRFGGGDPAPSAATRPVPSAATGSAGAVTQALLTGRPGSRAEDTRLGPYRLLERLGEGGMGVVHLGLTDDGRAVAVKVLRDHVAQDPAARERLRREFDSLQRVRHRLVAPVLGVDTEGPRPYLVTRYVPGQALDAWVEEHGPLAGGDLLRVARGLADALHAIHRAGVVHRDLKPANVLMLDGDPVVIDFGIAHVADEARLTSTGLVMGTPGYLSPELLDGDDVGPATDWWGWAATLAFASTGRPPFGRGPLDAVLGRVHRGEADLDGVDERLRSVLRAALAPDPARRPGREEVLGALDADAAGGDSVSALSDSHGPSAVEQVDRPVAKARPAADRTQTFTSRLAAAATAAFAASTGGRRAPAHADAAGSARPPSEEEDAALTRPQQRIDTRVMPRLDPAPAPQHEDPVRYASFRAPEQSPPETPPPPVAGTGAGTWAGSTAYPRHVPARPRSTLFPLAALFAALVALATSFPVLAVFVAAGWSVLARTVEASVRSVLRRREFYGARGSDVVRAVAASPMRLVGAALSTLLAVLLCGLAAMAALAGTAAVLAVSTGRDVGLLDPAPLVVGMTVGILLGWWGAGGRALRHGSRRLTRAIAPGRGGPTVLGVALVLVAVYFALRSQATGAAAMSWPLPPSALGWLEFTF